MYWTDLVILYANNDLMFAEDRHTLLDTVFHSLVHCGSSVWGEWEFDQKWVYAFVVYYMHLFKDNLHKRGKKQFHKPLKLFAPLLSLTEQREMSTNLSLKWKDLTLIKEYEMG